MTFSLKDLPAPLLVAQPPSIVAPNPGKLASNEFYCVPTALAAVTGLPGHEVTALINRYRGKRSGAFVGSAVDRELEYVLDTVNVQYQKEVVPHLPKLIRDPALTTFVLPSIVASARHVMVLDGRGNMLDTAHKRQLLPIQDHQHKHYRIEKRWVLLSGVTNPKFLELCA